MAPLQSGETSSTSAISDSASQAAANRERTSVATDATPKSGVTASCGRPAADPARGSVPTDNGSRMSGPTQAESPSSRSSTLRARRPWVASMSQPRARAGAAIRPGVGRIETTSQKLAGVRTEPPKSVPCARGAIPVATATAEPPEEPPDVNAASNGLRVGPHSRLVHTAPKPNSGVLVLPMMTAPACRSLATTSSS